MTKSEIIREPIPSLLLIPCKAPSIPSAEATEGELATFMVDLWGAFATCKIRHSAVTDIEKYRDKMDKIRRKEK